MKYSLLALFVVVLTLYSTCVEAQDLSTIVSKDGIQTQSIQALILNDSLFVFYSTAGKKKFNTIAVLPDGSQKTLPLEELTSKTIAGLRSTADQILFDFFDTSKDSVAIKSLSLNKRTWKKTTGAKSILLPGRVIGYETTNDSLTVLTYDAKTSTLHLHQSKNLKPVFSNQYPVNAQLFKEKATFIGQRGMAQPSDADADVKVYLDKKFLWIIAENESKPMSTSTVFKIDIVSGKAMTKGIFDYSGNKWNTTICGELILKVIKSNGILLEAHTFDQTDPIFSASFKEGSQIANEHAYERRGASNEVFPIDVQQSLKAWGRPIVIPVRIKPDSILLKIGNFEPQIIPKGSSLAYLGLVFELARIPSYLFNQRVSVDRYFYINGNFSQGFIYEPRPRLVDKVIDDFEVTDRQKPVHIKFKGYVLSRQAAFGLYKFEDHYDELKVKKFTMQ